MFYIPGGGGGGGNPTKFHVGKLRSESEVQTLTHFWQKT